jgi:arylsulfatase A-like enzyme
MDESGRRVGGDRPNIILINCDDLGYGDIGCYGSRVNKTPSLDRMAAEGLRFTDFYMASPLCSPSRGAMMTGCYPPRIGFGLFEGRGVLFPGQPVGLNPNERTFATILKEQGYAAMHVGKWHCGDQPEFLPTRHGFDGYFGLPYSNDMGRQRSHPNRYPPLPLMVDSEVIQQQPDQAALTERYVERSVRFIRENRNRSFLLYLAHMYVHLPIFVPADFLKRARNGSYGAAVECVDWAAGVLLDELKRLGIDENTLVIFTSDNGSRVRGEGGSNGILRGTKAETWEGGMRLPCIMRWPGGIPAGRECREVVSSIDFLPTFALLAGGREPRDRIIDGRDIGPLMVGKPDAGPVSEAFFYYNGNCLDAVRCGKWKLFVGRGGNHSGEGGRQQVRELYDLENDVGETRNVAEAHPDVVATMLRHVEACRSDIGDDAAGTVGRNARPSGRVSNPKPLTEYSPGHPYIIAEYDTDAAG